MFTFQVPAFVCALDGHLYGVEPVSPVDGINGCSEAGLFVTVDWVEENGLHCRIRSDTPNDDTSFLVVVSAILTPFGTECLRCCGYQFQLVVGGYGQSDGAVDGMTWHIVTETAGVGKYGQLTATALLLPQFADARSGKVGHSFFHHFQL